MLIHIYMLLSTLLPDAIYVYIARTYMYIYIYIYICIYVYVQAMVSRAKLQTEYSHRGFREHYTSINAKLHAKEAVRVQQTMYSHVSLKTCMNLTHRAHWYRIEL